MPVPLLWLGAGAIALLAGAKYSNEKAMELTVDLLPGEGDEFVKPIDGAIVSCGVYGVFDHTGIWLDGNIIELKGNGLIRAVSPKRFLDDRSGEQIFIACDRYHQPLISDGVVTRAVDQLFQYSEYDVFKNNCHKFTWQCISGENTPIMRFSEFNQKLYEKFSQNISWQKARV